MRAAQAAATVLTIVAAGIGVGCQHPARTTPVPRVAETSYCWHAVFHTALPPDTVAAHFARAFTTLGLTGATWTQRADTAGAQAGPTVLGAAHGGGTYAARVVAFRRGDTTLFRYFAAVMPPPNGWPPPLDTLNPTGIFIGFCGDLGRTAAVHGTAPQWPNGEENLPVWERKSW